MDLVQYQRRANSQKLKGDSCTKITKQQCLKNRSKYWSKLAEIYSLAIKIQASAIQNHATSSYQPPKPPNRAANIVEKGEGK